MKGQLESKDALERAAVEELKWTKDEMHNVVTAKSEEILSLKFQLSTEEMKKETAQKVNKGRNK